MTRPTCLTERISFRNTSLQLDAQFFKSAVRRGWWKLIIAITSPDRDTGKVDIDQAIAWLSEYKPVRGPAWEKYPVEEFDKYVPKWTEDGRRAHEWLSRYRDERMKK